MVKRFPKGITLERRSILKDVTTQTFQPGRENYDGDNNDDDDEKVGVYTARDKHQT